MKNVPELRFAGFDGEWEENRIGQLSKKVIGGGTPSTKVEKYWNGTIPWIQTSDLDDESIKINAFNKFISYDAIENSSAKIIEPGSISVVTRVGVGKVVRVNENYATSQDFTNLSELNSDTTFTTYSIKKIMGRLSSSLQGTSIKGITQRELLSTKLYLPHNQTEQEKIGDLFKKIDALIEKQEDKVSKLKDFKKSMIQKMFPKKDELVPEFRFDGFDDEWNKITISDLYSKAGSGGTPSSKVSEYYNGDIPFLSISDLTNSTVLINETGKSITELGLNNSSAWIVPSGSITLAMYASVGKVAISNIDLATSQAFFNMIINDNNSTEFVYQTLKKMEIFNEWRNQITTGTQPNLNATIINNTILLVPNLEEQEKIGNFFKNLDSKIETEKKLLDSYKMMKKSLLQKMFV